MPVTHDTLRLVDGLRIAIGKHVDDATRSLVGAWARAWDVLAVSWRHAVEDAIAASTDGAWPDAATLDRLDRVRRAFEATRTQVLALSELAGVTVVQVLPTVAAQSVEWHRAAIESELPTAEQRGTIGIAFNRVDARAIDAIVQRISGDVISYMKPISALADDVMRRRLVQGVALGENPRAVAAGMVKDLQGDFKIGRAHV